MNAKVILQVAYMCAFRPSFCLNGSFARVFKIFSHRQTDTQTHTHTHGTDLRKRGVIKGTKVLTLGTGCVLYTCIHTKLFWPAIIRLYGQLAIYISIVDRVHILMLEWCGGGAGSSLCSPGL